MCFDGLVEFVIDRGILAESQRRRPAAAAGIGGTRDRPGLVIGRGGRDWRLVGQRAGYARRRRWDCLARRSAGCGSPFPGDSPMGFRPPARFPREVDVGGHLRARCCFRPAAPGSPRCDGDRLLRCRTYFDLAWVHRRSCRRCWVPTPDCCSWSIPLTWAGLSCGTLDDTRNAGHWAARA